MRPNKALETIGIYIYQSNMHQMVDCDGDW